MDAFLNSTRHWISDQFTSRLGHISAQYVHAHAREAENDEPQCGVAYLR